MWFSFKVVLLCAFTLVQSEEVPPISDDEFYEFQSKYPYNKCQELSIQCANGNSIVIIIDKLHISMKTYDYLLIKPGKNLDDDYSGLVFTDRLKSERRYVLANKEAYFRFEGSVGHENEEYYGFHLKYQCPEKPAPTTTEGATTIDWPASHKDNNYTATVYGIPYNKFEDSSTMKIFRTAVSEMATEYCKTQNLPLLKNITEENVIINLLRRCPYNWPSRDNCIEITFALPIFLDKENPEYQLVAEHIELMWHRLANKYLKPSNMQRYTLVDESKTTVWIVIFAVVLLLFIILLMLGKFISHKLQKKISEMVNEIEVPVEDEKRDSSLLQPHPLQTTPTFLEQDRSYFMANRNMHSDI